MWNLQHRLNLGRKLNNLETIDFTKTTALGALSHYISDESVTDFQPMNVNFGIIEPLNEKIRKKKEKNEKIAKRAIDKILKIKERYDLV